MIVQRPWDSGSEGIVSVDSVRDPDSEGMMLAQIMQRGSDSNVATVGIASNYHGRKCHLKKNSWCGAANGMVTPHGYSSSTLSNYRVCSTFLSKKKYSYRLGVEKTPAVLFVFN